MQKNLPKLREKILYFFDNISKKDYKMKEYNPKLYVAFLELTKNYPDQRYSRRIQNIRNINHYILYRLSDKNKINMFIKYCQTHKIPMSNRLLKYFNTNLTMKELYILMHGGFPKCKECKCDLKDLTVQLYTSLESNSDRFCSAECQKNNHLNKVKNTLINEKSSLISYNSKFSTILCANCGNKLTRNTSNIFTKNMFTCNTCLERCSKGQQEIYNFLKEFDPDIKLEVNGILPRKIIDIYSEKFKIAIEFDGLMYHSYGISTYSMYNNINIDKKLHYNRMEDLNKKGIRLFRIWDIEWLKPTHKVKWMNILRNAFQCNMNKLYARKCQVLEVKSKDARIFIDDNHIQGFAPAKHYYGLYYSDELVSIMTFGTSIRSKGEWELLRFCNKQGCNIIGAASKLLKHFERIHNPKELISYANLRWSEGNIYNKLDFNLAKIVEPTYTYFKNNYDRTLKTYHRTKFTKSNIKKYNENMIYEIKSFNESLTEFENMFLNGYRIIYDCGMKKYIKYY